MHLEAQTELQTLNLCWTDLTDASVPFLQRMTSLRGLDLRGNKISDRGIDMLREALPQCQIVTGWTQ